MLLVVTRPIAAGDALTVPCLDCYQSRWVVLSHWLLSPPLSSHWLPSPPLSLSLAPLTAPVLLIGPICSLVNSCCNGAMAFYVLVSDVPTRPGAASSPNLCRKSAMSISSIRKNPLQQGQLTKTRVDPPPAKDPLLACPPPFKPPVGMTCKRVSKPPYLK